MQISVLSFVAQARAPAAPGLARWTGVLLPVLLPCPCNVLACQGVVFARSSASALACGEFKLGILAIPAILAILLEHQAFSHSETGLTYWLYPAETCGAIV